MMYGWQARADQARLDVLALLRATSWRNSRVYDELDLVDPRQLGLRYLPDRPGAVVQLIGVELLVRGGAYSCGTLACAVAGWLMHQGFDADVEPVRESGDTFHARVLAMGRIVFDPSKLRRAA